VSERRSKLLGGIDEAPSALRKVDQPRTSPARVSRTATLPLEVTVSGGTWALPLAVPRRETGVRRKPRRSQQVLASGPAFMKELVRLSVFAVKFLVSPPRLVVYSLF
jgi:hypothetical protein